MYIREFDRCQDAMVGTTSNNDETEDLSGGWTAYERGFGGLVAYVRRKFSTPLSRCCRLEDKLSPFLKDRGYNFKASEVMSLRGSAYTVTRKAPQLMTLILPRTDNMIGHMKRLYDDHAPADFEPSPAFDGESDYHGRQLYKVEMELMWRLLTIGNGEHVAPPPEIEDVED